MNSSAALFLSALLFLVLSAVGAQGHTAASSALRGGRKLQGGTCDNGLSDIEGIDGINGACCPLGCGQCGGDDCGIIPGYTSKECCATGVINNNPKCSESGKAPCYFPERSGTCSNGIVGIEHGNKNGHVCCDIECGVCGGAGCNTFPGGSKNCCIDTILQNSKDCAVADGAPCYLSDGDVPVTPVDSTPAPVDPTPTTPAPVGEGATCSNGIPGIDGANDAGEAVCCPVGCGLCGGQGCAKVKGFSNKECCANGILKNQPNCAVEPVAPCYISEEYYTGDPAPAPTPTPVVGGSTCSNGLPGIDGANSDGDTVCCPLECNQCGGQGCARSGAAAGLDNTSCCPNGIVAKQKDCEVTEAAPCVIAKEAPTPVINVDPTPPPTEGGSTCPDAGGISGIQNNKVGSGVVCCDPDCLKCGDFGCHLDPLGSSSCCIDIIIVNQQLCSEKNEAPCTIEISAVEA